jgi:hypothetical protein
MGVFVIDPQSPRPGAVVIAAAEERAVGGGGKGGLHFFLGGVEVVFEGTVFGFIHVVDACQACEELVVVRDVLRHRTGGEEK